MEKDINELKQTTKNNKIMNTREKQIEMLESEEHERRMAIIAQNGNNGEHYTGTMTCERDMYKWSLISLVKGYRGRSSNSCRAIGEYF